MRSPGYAARGTDSRAPDAAVIPWLTQAVTATGTDEIFG
ncbi:hypothetical protein DFR71_5068 [Nocardia alba]|uniref:Uncharacterized protein n=1 Tax=Nocardia alba TaxID=225051 RepID=A0A4R1FME1_9NOCA|nr:hypothetical protein DFR71_5068 [Nocardia alba]